MTESSLEALTVLVIKQEVGRDLWVAGQSHKRLQIVMLQRGKPSIDFIRVF